MGRGKTEGLATLNQALMRGLPSCRRVFGGRVHFSASLPLLALVKNISLMNPFLDPVCAGGGVHSLADSAGYSQGVHPWGCRRLPPGPAARQAPGFGGLPADGRMSPPGRNPVRGGSALRPWHLFLCCVTPLLCRWAALVSRRGAPPSH